MSQAFKSEHLVKYHERLKTDFPFAARWTLKIRTKSGQIEPLILNDAQRYIHEQIEKQKMAIGKVRALVLKGRQQGCSTYVSGRYYWQATHLSGKAVFILSHEASTTDKLFQLVERYHQNVPEPVKMQRDVANQRRMVFAGLNSEYFVGTAGNEDVGRGGTVQYLHASEAAFYPGTSGFSTGLLQSVPDADGTEVIIESTANGMDPLFYPMCMNAMQGKGEFILIFVPWFWQKEYRKKLPENFQLDPEEEALQNTYHLDNEQIYWRRMKIFELKDKILFMQEYPNSVEEAFTVSGDSLIPGIKAAEARKFYIHNPVGPLIVGTDPNEAGGPIGIVWRQGRKITETKLIEGKKPMEVVGILTDILLNDNPDKMFLDNGNGYGIIDRLVELGWGKLVMGVDFGGGATEDGLYLNMRAEMAYKLLNWFIYGPVQIPDDDLFVKHLCCVPKGEKTSSGLTKLIPKEIIIKNTQIDPHLFDAAILTFAYPVKGDMSEDQVHHSRKIRKVENAQSPLKSVQRREALNKMPGNSVFASAKLVL
jgi:hypothetical protein